MPRIRRTSKEELKSMVERRSRACSDTSASYLLLWPLFMHEMPPLFSTPRTATCIMHTSHTIHLKLSTLHYFRYQHLHVSIYKLVHPHSTHCIPETYFWCIIPITVNYNTRAQQSLCTLHTGLIMSTAICYLCYIKQCLGRGLPWVGELCSSYLYTRGATMRGRRARKGATSPWHVPICTCLLRECSRAQINVIHIFEPSR